MKKYFSAKAFTSHLPLPYWVLSGRQAREGTLVASAGAVLREPGLSGKALFPEQSSSVPHLLVCQAPPTPSPCLFWLLPL